jgi:hypothetical protein
MTEPAAGWIFLPDAAIRVYWPLISKRDQHRQADQPNLNTPKQRTGVAGRTLRQAILY